MNKIYLLTALSLTLIFLSCRDNSTEPKNSGANMLKITSVSPDTVEIGDYITIRGENFGIGRDTSFVQFNDIGAIEYQSWSDTLIIAKVPENSVSGKLSVTVKGKKSNEVVYFIYIPEPDEYESVTIGSQVWMTKNLDVETYRNGDTIKQCRTDDEWKEAGNLHEGAWCYYNNSDSLGLIYGKLYNWYAVNDPRGAAPEGWHVADDSEWAVLDAYLGGYEISGGKLKETGFEHWDSPNAWATNESGFTALPGGCRYYYGPFYFLGSNGHFWTATEKEETLAWYKTTGYYYSTLYSGPYEKRTGFSVRCIKD